MALKTLRARCFSQHVNLDTSLIDKMKVVDLMKGIEFSVTNSSRFMSNWNSQFLLSKERKLNMEHIITFTRFFELLIKLFLASIQRTSNVIRRIINKLVPLIGFEYEGGNEHTRLTLGANFRSTFALIPEFIVFCHS